MNDPRCVLITGAAGTMGRKLSAHWNDRYELRLLDQRSGDGIEAADLSLPGSWIDRFAGVDTVVHFAADPEAYKSWSELTAPNVDALIHVYHAAITHGVRRVIFASSNHVMGGYQDRTDVILGDTTPPQPGLRYCIDGVPRSSAAYAAAKLFGERLGACYAASHGLQTLAIRFGWIWRGGPNEPTSLPSERGEWFRLMWLSDQDFLRLMDCALTAALPTPFGIVNGVSKNTGMMWDLEPGRRLLGYEPVDDVNKQTQSWRPSSEGASPNRFDSTQYKWIDLTLPLQQGLRGFDWETRSTSAVEGWNTRTLHVYSHCGTHMDAQVHFDAGPETIDQIKLERCCGPARVVSLMQTKPKELLTVAHLGSLAHTFVRGEVLLLATGWSRHLDDASMYRDQLPRIGQDLAHWCVEQGVKVLGVEPPSVADVHHREEVTRIHRILLGGGVTIVEGLTGLDQLPSVGAWFHAAPLKVSGCDGSPCRAAAMLPQV